MPTPPTNGRIARPEWEDLTAFWFDLHEADTNRATWHVVREMVRNEFGEYWVWSFCGHPGPVLDARRDLLLPITATAQAVLSWKSGERCEECCEALRNPPPYVPRPEEMP